jgi:hypothetical protein
MSLARLSAIAGAAALICACASPAPPTPTTAPASPAKPAAAASAAVQGSTGPGSPASPTAAAATRPAAAATKPAAASAAKPAGGRGCPFATRSDAAAALGKDSLEGEPEGDDKCFFAAADTRSAPATEYVDVAVTRHDSAEDARILFDATSGRPGSEKLSGLGDAAVFVKDVDGGQILALKGRTTVLTGVRSKAQADPRGALAKLSQAVLAKV